MAKHPEGGLPAKDGITEAEMAEQMKAMFHIAREREAASVLYQIVGALMSDKQFDSPKGQKVLDMLSCMARGETIPFKPLSLLPWLPDAGPRTESKREGVEL